MTNEKISSIANTKGLEAGLGSRPKNTCPIPPNQYLKTGFAMIRMRTMNLFNTIYMQLLSR